MKYGRLEVGLTLKMLSLFFYSFSFSGDLFATEPGYQLRLLLYKLDVNSLAISSQATLLTTLAGKFQSSCLLSL